MTKPWYRSATVVDVEIDDTPLHAPAPAPEEEEVVTAPVPVEDARLGVGFNAFIGERCGLAVSADEGLIDHGTGGGQETLFELKMVRSLSELRKAMELSASAAFSGLLGGASAKARWVSEQKLHRESVYLLVKVEVKNRKEQLLDYRISEGAAAMLAEKPQNWWTRFYRKYGDVFVSAVTTGGEFFALYQFETQSMESKTALETQMNAVVGAFQSQSTFRSAIESIDTAVNTTCKLYVRGGRERLPEIKPETIIEAALVFPTAVDPENGWPRAYRADTKDYDVVTGFIGFPEPADAAFREAHRTFEQLTAMWERLERLEVVLESEGAMGTKPAGTLAALRDRISDRVKSIAEEPFADHQLPPQLEHDVENLERSLAWTPVRGALVQISVGSWKHVWGVSNTDTISRWNASEKHWEQINGRLINVSVAADGTTWGVNRDGHSYRWNGRQWQQMSWYFHPRGVKLKGHASTDQPLVQVSVGRQGQVWAISNRGNLYQWDGSSWGQRPTQEHGAAKWVSVARDGSVFLLNRSNKVFRWASEGRVESIGRDLEHISTRNEGEVWGIDTTGRVVRWDGEAWSKVPGETALVRISVGDDGTVWGVDGQGNIFRFNEALSV
ncbi:MAG: hypothetical protein GWN84_05420 [Gammaproteobacteria bacterium]|nr:hypothetical protein [Gammaproteobacteria bacterium]NIR82407.1 hypothetical protein [Gammaproteobacteria bacterium]NIR91988.1 hypothetical protein [Gammaproteobacteria bacterium]NIU03544.1 hypothetical protein [Gammaproteobacteria bacterium]NIX84818.1 hypothetical protein [Gammaproteobacteria bacterium]